MNYLILIYDPRMVFVSLTIAFFGSYAGINMYEQFRLCVKDNKSKFVPRSALLFLIACCIGGIAIWSMHFIAMAGITLISPDGSHIGVKYRVDYTIISLIAVVLLCLGGLIISSNDSDFTKDKDEFLDGFVKNSRLMSIADIRQMIKKDAYLIKVLLRDLPRLVIGGVLTAAGVCVMHYLGMEAMVFPGRIQWNFGIIAASVIIAIVAASAAFWILFRFLALLPHLEILRVLSAFIMSLAVNGMHYTGMQAATFVYTPSKSVSNVMIISNQNAISGTIAAMTILLSVVLLIALADLRKWYSELARISKEVHLRVEYYEKNPLQGYKFFHEYNEIIATDGNKSKLKEFRKKMSSNSNSRGIHPSNNLCDESIINQSYQSNIFIATASRPGTRPNSSHMIGTNNYKYNNNHKIIPEELQASMELMAIQETFSDVENCS